MSADRLGGKTVCNLNYYRLPIFTSPLSHNSGLGSRGNSDIWWSAVVMLAAMFLNLNQPFAFWAWNR